MTSTLRIRPTATLLMLVALGLATASLALPQYASGQDASEKSDKEEKTDTKNTLKALKAAKGDIDKIGEAVDEAIEMGPHTISPTAKALEREFRTLEKKYGAAFKKLAVENTLRMPADVIEGNEKLTTMRGKLEGFSGIYEKLREALPEGEEIGTDKKKSSRSRSSRPKTPTVEVPRTTAKTLFEELEFKEYQALGIGGPGMSKLEIECVLHTNIVRAKHNLRILVADPKLSDSARLHSKDMIDHDFRGHESPVPGRKTFRERGKLFNTRADGENVAEARMTGKEIVAYWMDSPVHKANILHPKFRRIGVGEYQNVWTQVFGGIDSFAR